MFHRSILLLVLLLSLAACATTATKEGTTFYPPLPEQPRLQYLTYITSEEDLGKSKGMLSELLLGQADVIKSIARAYSLTSVKGRIYISDRTLKQILIIDLEKNQFSAITDQREGALKDPFGITSSEDGFKYIADGGRKQIVVYGPDDKFVRAYGEEGQFLKPMDVALFENRLYVVDYGRNAILVVDKQSGKTLETIGKKGAKPGEMDRPTHIRMDAKGNIFVNDAFNFRIQKLDSKGTYLKEYGYAGSTLGGFGRPKGFDVSVDAKVFVADAAIENVQIFDDESTDLLLFFGTYSNAPGSLYLPSAVYIDYKNVDYFNRFVDKDFKVRYLVLVSSLLGDKKLNIYGYGDWIGPKLPEIKRPAIKQTEKPDVAK